MKIALAQVQSFPGRIMQNLKRHEALVEMAAKYQTDLIVFPELSISGYEPRLAKSLASTIDNPVLEGLKELSAYHGIIIAAGLPVLQKEHLYIGMIILSPEKEPILYCKQHLHEDEKPFFAEGQKSVLIHKDEYIIAPAICYESLLEDHVVRATKLGANIYLASVAKSEGGIQKANQHYPQIARKYKIPVLMVNNIGPADDFVGAGNSGVWNDSGELVQQLNNEEGLLIVDLKTMHTEYEKALFSDT